MTWPERNISKNELVCRIQDACGIEIIPVAPKSHFAKRPRCEVPGFLLPKLFFPCIFKFRMAASAWASWPSRAGAEHEAKHGVGRIRRPGRRCTHVIAAVRIVALAIHLVGRYRNEFPVLPTFGEDLAADDP